MNKTYLQLKAIFSIGLLLMHFVKVQAQENIPVHIGFMYPLSTNGHKALQYTNNLSLHAISGLSGGETGLALYGVAGIVKGDGKGFLASGVVTFLNGELQGIQMAGVMNRANNAPRGAQFAGVLNLNNGTVPVQLSGVVNQAQQVKSLQAAGVVNITAQLEGVQIAGVSNVSENVKGMQIAGVANFANQVKGSQFAGLVNKARTVKGVQLAGLMNIADSSDYPIGIINLIKNGEKRLGLSTDENLSTLLTFRSGGRKLYGIIGLGSNFQYDNLPYGFEGGLGIKLLEINSFRLDMEAVNLFVTDFKNSEYSKSGLRILPALVLFNKMQLYGGPSISYMNTKNRAGSDLAGLKLWEDQKRDNYKSIHAGYTVGIQVKL